MTKDAFLEEIIENIMLEPETGDDNHGDTLRKSIIHYRIILQVTENQYTMVLALYQKLMLSLSSHI